MSYIVTSENDFDDSEQLIRESDGKVIAYVAYDCPEDNNFGRSLSAVVDELNRLGEIEAKYEGLCK